MLPLLHASQQKQQTSISLKTSPLPVIVSPVKSSTTRKRGPPNRVVPVPPIQEEEGDDDVIIEHEEEHFSKKQKSSKSRVTSVDLDPDHYRQNTTLPVNVCYCGQNFLSKAELETHIRTTHEGWLCGDSSCTKVCENKNVLFKHVRNKHLLSFNFKCDKCPKSYEEWK